jgi:hypothetical protein
VHTLEVPGEKGTSIDFSKVTESGDMISELLKMYVDKVKPKVHITDSPRAVYAPDAYSSRRVGRSVSATNRRDQMKAKPVIRKLGTIDCDLVETTPVVFKGRLYRFEYVRANYKPNKTGDSYFRLIDVATGEPTPSFANGYHLGSAYVDGDTVYAYGVQSWGGSEISVFHSKDLKTGQSETALSLPGWVAYNTSVCKGPERFVMAIELGEPPEVVGVPYTMRFAESDDLIHWKITDEDQVFSKDRYTACPVLRFVGDHYYMIYLEWLPGPSYVPYIVRSCDLVHWQNSPYSPVLSYSEEEDKRIANPALTAEQRKHIAESRDINNSDIDLCEFQGKTVIYYSWGDQLGTEFLAEAEYDGSMSEFLTGFFSAK